MVYPISIDEVQSRFSRISDNIFDGIKETLVGVNRQILNFIHEIFPVDALVLFLSAMATEILIDRRIAILAYQNSVSKFHCFEILNVFLEEQIDVNRKSEICRSGGCQLVAILSIFVQLFLNFPF